MTFKTFKENVENTNFSDESIEKMFFNLIYVDKIGTKILLIEAFDTLTIHRRELAKDLANNLDEKRESYIRSLARFRTGWDEILIRCLK